MAVSQKGPYEVRIPYVTADGYPHTWAASCIVPGSSVPVVGELPENILLVTRGGSIDLQTGVDEAWGALRQRLPSTTIATGYSLWYYADDSSAATFISSGDLTVPDGASGALVASQQEIRTFRTGFGGIAKIVLMDTREASSVKIPIPPTDEVLVWALGATGWIIGRDNGHFVAGINLAYGQNERLFKARNRK